MEHQGARYDESIGLYENNRPGEVFLSGAKVGSDIDGLLSDVGVLLSRALQFGDSIEALRAGMGRLGGSAPVSIVGLVLDQIDSELSRNAGDEPPAIEGG